jgi:hypothetical protein
MVSQLFISHLLEQYIEIYLRVSNAKKITATHFLSGFGV